MKKPSYFRSLADGHIIETHSPAFWSDPAKYETLSRADGEVAIMQQVKDYLLDCLKPGQTVYCQVVSVSPGGSSRTIKLFAICDDKLINFTHNAARVLGYKMHKNGGVIITGGGMDMAFNTVYNLGRVLWQGDDNSKDAGYSLKSKII